MNCGDFLVAAGNSIGQFFTLLQRGYDDSSRGRLVRLCCVVSHVTSEFDSVISKQPDTRVGGQIHVRIKRREIVEGDVRRHDAGEPAVGCDDPPADRKGFLSIEWTNKRGADVKGIRQGRCRNLDDLTAWICIARGREDTAVDASE